MIKVVTAFIELPGNPRPAAEYHKLGDQLIESLRPAKHRVFGGVCELQDTWMFTYLAQNGMRPTPEVADNPQKNTIGYHMVQHQKTTVMTIAALADSDPNQSPDDVFCWIDYGIFHVPGVTATVIQEFLERAKHEKAIAIPGCWDKPTEIEHHYPCWRFCGGVIVCPRKYLMDLDLAVKLMAVRQIKETNKVEWEVNTLARLEQCSSLPIWQYRADHDASMFTAYPETRHAS